MTIKVLHQRGKKNTQIAEDLGVTEGAIRYHIKKAREGREDGRKKVFKAESHAEVIREWMEDHEESQKSARHPRPANVKALHDYLVLNYGYTSSYKSVLRFVRDKYPKPRIRPYRRIETPAGAQMQLDWCECREVDLGFGPETVYGFVMTLSHSRKSAVIWRRGMDQLSWHQAHNEAFSRLGGVAAVARIDNLKTGVSTGAGPWGELNKVYKSYAKAVGFHIDPCLPRSPEHKGKVESGCRYVRLRVNPSGRSFDGLAGLQAWSDELFDRLDRKRTCPATGRSVHESWLAEQELLRPADCLPEVFDIAVNRKVHKDCIVNFEGRSYSVPFQFTGRFVEVRGCPGSVQIFCDGVMIKEWERGSERRLLVDSACYEGEGDERVMAPVPLGKMAKKLQEIADRPVQLRSIDIYAELAEVAQ